MHFVGHHTQFGKTPSTDDGIWLYGGEEFRYKVAVSGGGVPILDLNPNARSAWYCLLWQTDALTPRPGGLHSDWRWPAEDYAATNGLNVEDLFVHAVAGSQNVKVNFHAIDSTGLMTMGVDPASGKPYLNSWYTPGSSMTIINTGTIYDGVRTIVGQVGSNQLQLDVSGATAGTGIGYQPGDGTLTMANRWVRFYFVHWFYVLNPWSLATQQWVTYKHGQELIGDSGRALKEVFYDSFNSSQMPAVTSLVESQGAGSFVNGLTDLLSGFRTSYPGTVTTINTANYIDALNTQMAVAAGGDHCEVLLNPFNYDPDNGIAYMQDLISKGVYTEAECSRMFDNATPQAGVSGLVTNFINSGGHLYPDYNSRAMLLNYTTFLVRLNDSDVNYPDMFARFDPANQYWDTNIQAKWYPFFEYPIGRAKGPGVRVVNGNLAADGGSVTLWQREYTTDGANTDVLVLVNRKRFGSEPLVYGAGSLYTYTLPAPPAGKSWRLVLVDKSLGNPLPGSIDLYAAEGAILKAA